MELWLKALEHLTDNTGFQGRLQVVSNAPRVIFDVSHNVEGIEATLSFLLQDIDQNALYIVYGSSSDKNFEEILRKYVMPILFRISLIFLKIRNIRKIWSL